MSCTETIRKIPITEAIRKIPIKLYTTVNM